MGTNANAKVTHYYNCYNGDFIGCLRAVHSSKNVVRNGCFVLRGELMEIPR